MITTNNGGFPWRGLPGGDELERATADFHRDPATAVALREARDRVTRRAIAAQVAAGCDLITDGRAGREDAVGDALAGLEGVEIGPPRPGYPAGGGTFRVPVIRGEVSWKTSTLAEDYLFGARGLDRGLKVLITGPCTLAWLAEDHAYGDPMALAMALATALNQELRAVQAAGAPVIQVDEPAILGRPEAFPVFTRVWEVLGRGVQTALALHLEGGAIAPLAQGLARLKRLRCLSVDCVTVEANLEALAGIDLPAGCSLGLGLVSGSDPGVEPPDRLAARVRAVAGLPSGDRIQLGTGTDLAGLTPEVATAKLKALDEARRILATA